MEVPGRIFETFIMWRRRLELLENPRPNGAHAALRSDREEVGAEWKVNNPSATECGRTESLNAGR